MAYTPTRIPVSFQYAITDIGDIIPSHLLEGNHLVENAAFRMAGGVQPRDRGRLGSYAFIIEQAKNLIPDFLLESADVDSGAPVVGPNMTIEAGNGRWLILDTAYELGKGGIYKRELVSRAKQYGLDPARVEKIERPILVRMRTTPLDVQAFAEAANVSRTLKQSPSEIARQDAGRLTPGVLSLFIPSESGEIHSRANRAFIQRFMEGIPVADRGELTTATGELSVLGLARIRNALMMRAYGDPDIVVRIAESLDDNAKNLTAALVRLAPRYAGAAQRIASGDMFPALDISKDLVAVIRVFSRLKDERTDLADYLAQITMFGRELTPEQEEILKVLWAFSRSSRRVGDFLAAYLDLAEGYGSPKQMGFLSKPISKLETIREAARKVEEAGVDPTASLFAAPTPVARPVIAPLPPPAPSAIGEALALSSPSGKISKRALKAAQERIRKEIFPEGMEPPSAVQPEEAETLLRQAKELRDLAARGMKPRAHKKKAEELEERAARLKHRERSQKEPVAIAAAAPEMAPVAALPSELWSEAKPETWPSRKPSSAIEEAKQGGTQAFFVEGPRGGYRGVVMLSDLETFLKVHPSLRLKPIYA